MNKQGGPGNEHVEPGKEIPINQSRNADRIMAVCFVVAAQQLLRLAIWPEHIKPDSPDATGRLEFLVKEMLREIKNMPAQGSSEADEAAAKQTAIGLVTQISTAFRREIGT